MAGRRTEKQQLERDYVNVMQEEENIQLEEESLEDWLAAQYWKDYVREKEEAARRQKYYYY